MQAGFVSFQEVKQAVSLEAVLDRYGLLADLTPKGANLAGACPFCKAKASRPFQASLGKSAWYCFGCKAGGNVLDFVAKREGLSLRAAGLALDRWFGLGLAASEAPAPPAEPDAEEPPPPAAPRANAPLAFTLKTLDSAHTSLAGLGIGAETLELFGAGYCARGLLKGRLAIPVCGRGGELLAYAGRALDEETAPRYLLPPNFNPALEVFNLHCLRASREADGPVYLTAEIEGVLRLAAVGLEAALGLFDGSLSAEQEAAIAEVLGPDGRLLLVGEGFADRTVARLARHAALVWLAGPAAAPAADV